MDHLSYPYQSSWVKRFFRRFCWLVLILAVLFFGGWGFENIRGGGEWRKAKERAARMGVSLKLEDYAAEEIPEGERLMEDPVFLAEWNGEIEPELGVMAQMGLEGINPKGRTGALISKGQSLDYRQYFEEKLSEDEAVRRMGKTYKPVATRLKKLGKVIMEKPVQDLGMRTDDYTEAPNSMNRLLKVSLSFRDLAQLSIKQGDSKRSLWACEVIARLAENFSKPAFYELLTSESALLIIRPIIWDGIRLHHWTEEDLDRLSALLSPEAEFLAIEEALKFEASLTEKAVAQAEKSHRQMNEAFSDFLKEDQPSFTDHIRSWMHYRGPEGWQNWRKATVLNDVLDAIDQRPTWSDSGYSSITMTLDAAFIGNESFHPLSAFQSGRGYESQMVGLALRWASMRRVIRIGIELERFHLRKGHYPETLDEVALGFQIQDLTDLQRRDFQYEKSDDRYFRIWSEYAREKDGLENDLGWRFSEAAKKEG